IALRLPASVSRVNCARSFSIGSLVGQPNHALSPPPPRTDDTAGVIVSNDVDHVWKMFQPPCAGGSFFARRDTIVDQSIACKSTLAPRERRSSAVTRADPCANGVSVGSMTTSGRPSYPDSFSRRLARSRSGFGAATAVSYGRPPHMNTEGQERKYLALPMTACRYFC